MKFFKRLSLRMRLTLLTWALLTGACVIATVLAILLTLPHRAIFRAPEPEESQLRRSIPIEEKQEIMRSAEENAQAFRLELIFSMLGVITVGTVSAYFIAGSALKPITKLSADIEARDGHDLFTPINIAVSHDEVAHLGESFNALIEKLRDAYEKQKRFAGNAAHELKTPLASMLASIEVFNLGGAGVEHSDEEYKEVFSSVYDNSMRLNGLVSNLLQLSKTNEERVCTRFSAEEVVGDVVATLTETAKAKGVRLTAKCEAGELYGEKPLIKSIIFNLTENAIRYNKENGSVAIATKYAGNNVVITVTDTGIGIAEDEQKLIFEPFYCVDKSRSRAAGGSGLGLSLVKTIVERHGGSIEVKSKVGEGAEFVVTLPK